MKKALVVLSCVGALVFAGCGAKDTPETFGKKYVEKKFSSPNCDLSGLKYTVTEGDKDTAKVTIEGKINYKEELKLAKKDGEWAICEKEVKKATPEKKAEEKKVAKAEAHAPAKAEVKQPQAKKAEKSDAAQH